MSVDFDIKSLWEGLRARLKLQPTNMVKNEVYVPTCYANITVV